MLAAYFLSCVIVAATGQVECNNSYTEMDSAVGKGQSCPVVAKELHQMSLNNLLIVHPEMIVVFQRSGCGTMEEVKAEAENTHKSYIDNGVPSSIGQF